jgi:ribosomal RNA assembly protein
LEAFLIAKRVSSVIEEVNIPEDRKGALIGKNGSAKQELEERSRTTLTVNEGVVIEGDDPLMVMKAAEVVKAIGRGFSPERAMLLLMDEYELRIVSLEGETDNTIKRLMARVIGKKGSTRKILEQETNCLISIYGKTAAIIGKSDEVMACQEAVEQILKGRSHGYVYARLRK